MTSLQQDTVHLIADEVKKRLEGEGSGHDWWHVWRAWNTAKRIGEIEGADTFVVELAALLHDIADWKAHDGDESAGPRVAREVLDAHAVPSEVSDRVCEIIASLSFKGAGVRADIMETIEGKVVQDADRLDAMGAIGIARTFTYGGNVHRPMYDPNQPPILHETKEAYLQEKGTTMNHFYEKLLLLKDRMNTETAKRMAEERHHFMEIFLEQFMKEWGDS